MTGGFPQAPLYSGWQVAPAGNLWRAFDTGIVAASLALSGLSLRHADALAALGDCPGQWVWDAHFETLRGTLPAMEPARVGEQVGAVVARLHGAAQAAGCPANPLLADFMAIRILLAEVSPLKEAAWNHCFPGVAMERPLLDGVLGGLRALLAGDAQGAVGSWQPWLGRLGLPAFDRLLQALYKADPDYGRLEAATRVAQGLWSLAPADPAHAAPLVELLLYFGRSENAGQILAMLPSGTLPALRQRRAGLMPPAPAACGVSILLISWNRAALLDQTLSVLRRSLVLPDTEILVGLNGCSDDSAAVLERHGISPALVSPDNRGIDLYRDIFPLARGRILLEIDDDLTALPPGLDALLQDYLQAFPAYGALSILPRVRQPDGQVLPAKGASYGRERQGQMEVHHGSMWGCCLAIRREDFYAGNGFYGATLSKRLGEEDQLMRKLYLRQRKFGYIDCGGLEILL